MKKLFIFLLLTLALHSVFMIEQVDVAISNIQDDGSAQVHESLKFVMYGDYENSLYDSGISQNDLSFWTTNIGLKDLKLHVNPSVVDIRDFRLRPQPRTKCNPIQGICHGELILDYAAFPNYKNGTSEIIPNTGLFTIDNYKPRTTRYKINPTALSFTTTPDGNIILDSSNHLTIHMPEDSVTLDVNPASQVLSLPAHTPSLSWNDIVLVKFSLIFDVENGIDQEVSDFFTNILRSITDTIKSPHGLPMVALVLILIATYLYIIMVKRRGDE